MNTPRRSVTVGIDIGTTSVKAVAADSGGHVLVRRRRPHEFRSPARGLAEHDAADAWHAGVEHLWEDTLADLDGVGDLRGVCVSALVPSLTAVDASGRPLGEGLIYGDSRGGADEGPPISNGEQAGFLRWLAREYPSARGYWPASTVANFVLAGVAALDEISALAASPLVGADGWDAALCAEAGASTEQLPVLTRGWSPVGEVAGAPLCGGIIDGLAEMAVSGATDAGDVLVTLGGTLICWVVSEHWVEIPSLWSVPHLADGRCLIGGPLSAGGVFLDRVRFLLDGENARATNDEDERALNDVAGGDLPVWVPSVRPERIAAAGGAKTASVHGLDRNHGRPQLFRAAYEASGFMVRRILEASGVEAKRILAGGGGSTSGGWLAALADCTGLEVKAAAVAEGAALGAAFAARISAGLEGGLADAARWARTRETRHPQPANADAVEGRYRRFKKLLAEAGEWAETGEQEETGEGFPV